MFSDDDITIEAKFSRADKKKTDLDNKYMVAVESGDMETAQKLVDLAARDKGYISGNDYRMSHQAPNREDYNLATIKESGIVPDDYWTHPRYYQSDPTEFESFDKINRAIERQKKTGKKSAIQVYRAVPKDVKDSDFRNGDWVTPSREYAVSEGEPIPGGYRIITNIVNIEKLWWDANSINEMGYDDGKAYAYKNTKNNRKLIDPATYDDDGNVIPLSKRFNSRSDDARFSRTAMPDTISINGDDRPTRDSEGNLIHPSEEGIRNFYEWFADSKITDSQGRPLVLYHGTRNDFSTFDPDRTGETSDTGFFGKGIYLTPSKSGASIYASHDLTQLEAKEVPGGQVMPLYVRASKVHETTKPGMSEEKVRLMKQNGFDAIFSKQDKNSINEEDELVVFDPSQVKSAIGNSGEFSKDSNDIKFSRAIPETLNIEGTDRPTRNSNGQLIHPSEEGIRNFWKWFTGSKVTDDMGRPMVVYHGSPDLRFIKEDGTFKSEKGRYGFGRSDAAHWFTNELSTAKSYADPKRAFDYQNAEEGIVEAYIKITDPLVINAQGSEWKSAQRRGSTSDVIESAKVNGNDGVVIKSVKDNYNNNSSTRSSNTFTVFDSNQIKSANDNSGA
ncbi:MAG TPA: hypothetical protein VK141_04530, partial [Nitrosomonas sp.]|nr:hypothetical protein [Nitrosomonas sp.]